LKSKRECCIENIYKICNEKAEAIEFVINESTKNKNKKLKDIKFNKDTLVATIVRKNKIIIPTGDESLQINDRVIIVTKDSKLLHINNIFLGGGK
ncbi:MAG: TrkA C-terminal domain-containing protein, partial [Clostridium sp.]